MMDQDVSVSIVVPAYNEATSLPRLVKRIMSLEKKVSLREVIIVDDGSTDDTVVIIKGLNLPLVRLITHQKRCGQTAALRTGVTQAGSPIIVTIDADLQNHPEDIPLILTALDTADLVTGVRSGRQDPLHKIIPSRIANKLLSLLFAVAFQDSGCGLRAMRREVFERMPLKGNIHRLFPFYVQVAGFKVKEVAIQHSPRLSGKSKYGLERVLILFIDGIYLTLFSLVQRRSH